MSALSHVKVLELAEGVAGEYCGKLLADFGAQVIKIERPGSGSPTRRLGPFGGSGPEAERSGLFAYLNTGKQSLALDVSGADGIDVLGRLLAQVDVVIDDHGPGWLSGIGLDPERFEQAHPHRVLCSITPFGQAPPDERRHAEDLTVFHASGWGYHTPSGADPKLPPLKGPGRFLASYESGLEAALCVVAALFDREASQLGRVIDVSKHAVLASRTDYVLAQMVAGDMDTGTRRDAFDLRGPAGIFACRDGFVYIWMSTPGHWEGLRTLLGDPAWMKEFPERWLERECTPERVARCRQHVGDWLKTQGKRQAAEDAQKLGLIAAEVNDAAGVAASPQYAHRGFFASVEHPVLGALRHPGVPYKLSATPASIRSPAPLLGQHTDATLSSAGKSHG
jgi:crotonobetainyl-CoA:carnitine CoA-transferase CaiB-like acyl-CoA transferase